jgi:hypothetical protein
MNKKIMVGEIIGGVIQHENFQAGDVLVGPDGGAITSALGLGDASTMTVGSANGVAALDGTGKVPISQLPIGDMSGLVQLINGKIVASQLPIGTEASEIAAGNHTHVNVSSATNIAGGTAGSIPYQTASGTTAMLANSSTAGYILRSLGGANGFAWYDPSSITVGAATTATTAANATTATTATNVSGIVAVANGGTGVNASSVSAKYFLAAPNGTSGAPTFRAILATDIPTLNQNTTGSSGSCTGNAVTATTATTATTALRIPTSDPGTRVGGEIWIA